MRSKLFTKIVSMISAVGIVASLVTVLAVSDLSAAGSVYYLNNAGSVTTVSLENGAALPTPEATIPAMPFKGWYNKDLSQKYTTAGDNTSLYAVWESNVLSFDDGTGLYHPHDGEGGYSKLGEVGSMTPHTVTDDPTGSATNKVMYLNLTGNKNNTNMAFLSVSGTEKGLELASNTKYVLAFRYYIPTSTSSNIQVQFRGAVAEGVGKSGGKAATPYTQMTFTGVTSGWQDASLTFTTGDTAQFPLLMMNVYDYTGSSKIYIDDIALSAISDPEKTYTFNNRGTVSETTLSLGADLPEVKSSTFLGWYDKSLTYRFVSAPIYGTELYAKYDGVLLDFDSDGIFNPNNTSGKDVTLSRSDAAPGVTGSALLADLSGVTGTVNVGLEGAVGSGSGLTLTDGKMYKLRFRYYAENVSADGVSIKIGSSAIDGVGRTGGTKNDSLSGGEVIITAANAGKWVDAETVFTYSAASNNEKSYVILMVRDNASSTAAKVWIDNVDIRPYAVDVTVPDFVMDFENGFKWSVDAANRYSENSSGDSNFDDNDTSLGSNYVSRGQLKTEDGNTFFNVKNFRNRNGYYRFAIDDGSRLFETVAGGIYRVSFDYCLNYCHDATSIGVACLEPNSNRLRPIATVASFKRGDANGWQHADVTFYCTSDDLKNLVIFDYSEISIPVEYATDIDFDNVVVKTYSTSGDKTVITFDSKGGSACEPLLVEDNTRASALPVPSKYGYDFLGWKFDTALGTESLDEGMLIEHGQIDAYATWKINDSFVELSFKTNVPDYDNTVQPIMVKKGEPIENMPADPSISNHEFVGWYLDPNFKTALNKSSAPSVSGTVYAKWKVHENVLTADQYPTEYFKKLEYASDRWSIVDDPETGNKVWRYSFADGSNQSTTATTRFTLSDGVNRMRAFPGSKYTVKIRYKMLEIKSDIVQFNVTTATEKATWTNNSNSTYQSADTATDGKWKEVTFTFNAIYKNGLEDSNYIAVGAYGNAKFYIESVTVTTDLDFDYLNVYGSYVAFIKNNGQPTEFMNGEVGANVDLFTPKRAGYIFDGWYTDSSFETKIDELTFDENVVFAYAKWRLGRIDESFENFNLNEKFFAMSEAYTIYNSEIEGFDPANVHSGKGSLLRNSGKTGSKAFTLIRSLDNALDIGGKYKFSIYVKPTNVTNPNDVITLVGLNNFISIANYQTVAEIAKVGDLKVGEWQQIWIEAESKFEYYGIATGAGNDIYFDDASIVLDGYTGSAAGGAETGDRSVSPIAVAIAGIVSAAAAAFVIYTNSKKRVR